MYIMNLIHEICLTKNLVDNIPTWKFVTKNKQIKKLNNDIDEFLNLDVFDAANNTISFLISLDREITENIDGYITYADRYIDIQVYDEYNEYTSGVLYYPKRNIFEVSNPAIAYRIYRNERISRDIIKMWEPLVYEIKKRYLDIIIQMADALK